VFEDSSFYPPGSPKIFREFSAKKNSPVLLEPTFVLSNFGRRGWRSGRKGAQNAPGLVRAATPADEMDKTVNVSVMEGLNTGVRGNKHLPRNRNRHCDCEHNNGVRLGTPAGAVGRSFGEALCIQLFWVARLGWLRGTPARVGDVQGLCPVWLEAANFLGQRKCAGASYRATNQWSIPRKVQKHYILSCRVLRNPAACVYRGRFLLTCAISYLFVKHFGKRAAGTSDKVHTSRLGELERSADRADERAVV